MHYETLKVISVLLEWVIERKFKVHNIQSRGRHLVVFCIYKLYRKHGHYEVNIIIFCLRYI